MKHLFINEKIFTSDAKHPYADAMVVQDRKILWTGEQDAMSAAWKEEIASVTDLEGRRVIPGFVDAHMHPVMLADFRKKITIMPPEINSIEELVSAIQKKRSQPVRGFRAGAMTSRDFPRNDRPIDMIWIGDAVILRYPSRAPALIFAASTVWR